MRRDGRNLAIAVMVWMALQPCDARAADFSAWDSALKIRFAGYSKPESLTNWPALIVLGTNVNGFDYGQFAATNGYELRFSAADEVTELNYEVEKWNPAGSSYVWVQIPLLSGSGDSIWAYWGNAAATAAPPSYSVNGATWASSFAGVWHLATLNGSTTPESTPGGNGGTVSGGATCAPTNGIAASAWNFDGLDDYIRVPRVVQDDFTIAFWMKADGNSLSGTQWYNGSGLVDGEVGGGTVDFGVAYLNNTAVFGTGSPDVTLQPAVTLNDAKWHHVAATRVRASGAKTIYIDGVDRGSQTGSTASLTAPAYLMFGQLQTGIQRFDGLLDEVELSGVVRSSNWIWACWANVASNSWFNEYETVSLQSENPMIFLK